MRSYLFAILIFTLLFTGCKSWVNHSLISLESNNGLKKKLKIDLKNWHFKDIIKDTIPGISLERVYDELLQNKTGKDVIVAVIDMEVDIDHKELQGKIWTNLKEIFNNNIDDDQNGYIDDIYGWNFLGNAQGENNRFVNYEYTRILKRFNSKFKDKSSGEISPNDSINFKIYGLAQKYYNNRMRFAVEDSAYANMIFNSMTGSKMAISNYLKNENYSIKKLDSLKLVYPEDKELQKYIRRLTGFIKNGYTQQYIDNYKLNAEERINKLLNLEYDDRIIQGDDSDNISDLDYGNNILNANIDFFDHGTKMAGIISNIGLKGEIKIMSLSISSYGDEHDKDIALAIRYAVDNGAKVINISFGKEFSLHYEWVADAIKYAEKNNVLLVSSAGNDGINLDNKPYLHFPNDHNYFKEDEISNNFLKVGSSGKILDKSFKLTYSNYGKKEVDVFAPGQNIYTTLPNNKYTNSAGGTSSASAITSGVAALIYSYYPNLTAYQVKKKIMDSGLEYNVEVSTPTEKDKNKTRPFNQLSKSGKVVNVYNAFLLADKY